MAEKDIVIDFGKLFKKGKKPRKKKAETARESDELTIDPSKVLPLAKKFSFLLFLIIPLIFSTYYRMLPNSLGIADDFARDNVYSNIKSQIKAEINQQFPMLPDENKNAEVERRFAQILSEQGPAVEEAITQNAQYIKDHFKDDKGYTYLGDIDSYFWLRYAENILKNGHPGDEIRDGVPYDNHMVAPKGMPVVKNMYPYIEAFLFSVLRIFSPQITVMQAAFYTPLYLSLIAVVAGFFIGKKIAGNIGGFFAAMMIAVNPTIITRSLGSDNDIVNVVFPLLILWLFLVTLDSDTWLKKISFTALTGLLMGLYSFAWSGYWHILYFLIGTLIAYIGYRIMFNVWSGKSKVEPIDAEVKGLAVILAVFVMFSLVSVAVFYDPKDVLNLPKKPFKILTLKEASKAENLWPNVYTTVAELNEASLTEIINNVGGSLYFVLSLMGIILSLCDFSKNKWPSAVYIVLAFIWFNILIAMKDSIRLLVFLALMWVPISAGFLLSIYKQYKADVKYALILLMWFSATIYASTKGIRFILLIIPAFVVGLSLFIGKAYVILTEFISEHLQLNKIVSQAILLIFIGLFLLQPARSGYSSSRVYMPHINDGWFESLQKIRTESAPNAIINSWWDFGHWFKQIADRAVTADGASQNDPQAHWVGNVLLTDDEDVAVGILRMLDCGSNDAYNQVYSKLNDPLSTIKQLYEIIPKDKEAARKLLSEQYDDAKVEEILATTHCSPPEDYFITSEDMVGKSGVWAHFGIWSFDKAKIYFLFSSRDHAGFLSSMKEIGYTEEYAEQIYYELQSQKTDRQVNNWIAPWPSYGGAAGCGRQEDMLVCQLNLGQNQLIPFSINLTTMDAYVITPEKNIFPNSFAYLQDNEYIVKKYSKDLLGYSIALQNESNQYAIIFMSPELIGSMFTRLFFFEGVGLSHFDKFSDIRDITGQRIIVWKVDWEGNG